MARNDELDKVLSNPGITTEEWQIFSRILDLPDLLTMSPASRRENVNRAIRHAYGHTAANIFRSAYEPDYLTPILMATAKKLGLVVDAEQVEAIEDRIIIKVLALAKEKIIAEKGMTVWNEVEKSIQVNIDKILEKGVLPHKSAEELRKIRGAALMAALFEGRFAGLALYVLVNQTVFAMARGLGVQLTAEAVAPILGSAFTFLLGPAGMVMAGLLLFYDLGNSNWEKVIAAVLLVAAIRKRLLFS